MAEEEGYATPECEYPTKTQRKRRANYIRVNKNYGRHAQNFNYTTREIIIAASVMSGRSHYRAGRAGLH